MWMLLAACTPNGTSNPKEREPDTATTGEREWIDVPRSGSRLLSPYNLLLTPDLDGDGTPQLIAPAVGLPRGVEVWDVDGIRSWTPGRTLPGELLSDQAAHAVALAGDLDGDGLPELSISEVDTDEYEAGEFTAVQRWWSVANDVVVGRLTWDQTSEHAAAVAPMQSPLPDYDGDGLPELLVCTDVAYVFRGSQLSSAMTLDEAWFSIDAPIGAWTVTLPDGDGDGSSEIGVWWGMKLVALYSTTLSAGADIVMTDQPLVYDDPSRSVPPAPAIADLDGDGLPELIEADGVSLRGFSGSVLRSVLARERGPLTDDDAAFRFSTRTSGDVGLWVRPWDGAGGPAGLAASDYFNSRFLLLNADVIGAGGGFSDEATTAIEGEGWLGYVRLSTTYRPQSPDGPSDDLVEAA